MGFLDKLVGVAAPIVGGMIGGPMGSAIGGAVGGALGGGGNATQAQATYAQQGGLQTPGAVSKGEIQTLPDWYTNYAKTVTNHGLGLADTLPGYQGYVDALGNPAPRVAGLSGTQQQGIDTLKGGVGTWKGGLAQATNGLGTANNTVGSGVDTVKGASGMFGKAANAYDQSMVTTGQAKNMVGTAMGTVNGALGTVNNALDTFGKGQTQIDAASGAIGKMGGALDASMNMLPGAQGYLKAGTDGSEFSADKMSQYMNPYVDGVTKEIARLGARNLNENLLPGVNSTFTGAGQFGSARNADFTNRAIRDTNESILGQQSKVLSDAQAQALQLAQGASERNLTAGAQTGALAGVAQGAASGYGSQAGTQINQGQATVGVGQGQLGASGQQLGAANTQLSGANTTLDAARTEQAAGNGYNQTGNNIVNQGQTLGQLGGVQGGLAQTAGGLAQTGQGMNLSDAQALMNAGAVEQSTNQKGMDAAYQDFLDQRDYPYQALGALSSLLPNVSGRVTGNTQSMTLNSANQPAAVSKYQTYADILGGLSAATQGAQR